MNWKKLFKTGGEKIFGLDIGSSCVKAVQMQKMQSGYRLKAAATATIADFREEVSDNDEMATIHAIRQCIDKSEMNARMAVCSVSGQDVAARCFGFPPLASEEIESAMRLEAEQVCPFSLNNAAVDYQVVSDDEKGINGVLVAATNELIGANKHFVESASLKPVLMDVDGLALLNCLSELEEVEVGKTVGVLNIGSSHANLAIIGSDGLPFLRDINHGGNHIMDKIAAEHGLERDIVNQVLAMPEQSQHSQAETNVYASLPRVCTRLANDIAKTLRYYQAQEQADVIETLFVSGGFAVVKGVVEALDDQLKCMVRRWNPFVNVPCDDDLRLRAMVETRGEMLAVAAGLAMRFI